MDTIPTFEELFKQIKTNFWLAGIPYGDPKIYFRFYFFSICLILILAEEISFLFSKISSENMLELMQLAPCSCIGVLSILKIISIAMKRRKIYELTECLDALYQDILNSPKKIQIVKKDITVVKFLSKYFFFLNLALISVYNFSILIYITYHYIKTNEVTFSLPYAVIVPFSTETWATWSIVYIHSIMCGFICVLYFTTVDVMYCILTCHVCCNFSIISDDVQKLNKTNNKNLGDIIHRHQYIIELSEKLEDIFTAPNLFNVLVGSLEICALGFNLTMGDWTQIPGCVLFLLSVLLQILMMSVFGENIIRESKKVGEAAFLCKWYDMDVRSKKTILLLMTRSHKAQKLTAYKFSVICYESFTKIISTSWSYFTILKTVYKAPDTI